MTLFDLLLFLFLFFSSFVAFLMLFYQTWRTHQGDGPGQLPAQAKRTASGLGPSPRTAASVGIDGKYRFFLHIHF